VKIPFSLFVILKVFAFLSCNSPTTIYSQLLKHSISSRLPLVNACEELGVPAKEASQNPKGFVKIEIKTLMC